MSFITVRKRRSMGSRIPLPGCRVLYEGPHADWADWSIRRKIDARLIPLRDAQRELKARLLAEMWAEEDPKLGVKLHRR